MDNIREIVFNTPKLTIKEFDYLLKNKNIDNKNIFIEGFLRYIFSITKSIYELYKNEFNAYYSYEDFFQDSVCLSEKVYDKFTYHDKMNNNFNVFCNYVRLKIPYLLTKTYMFKISYETWLNILENRRKYYNNTMDSNKFEKYWLARIQECISLEASDISIPSFENELINNLVMDNLHEDIINILKTLKLSTRDILCKLNGFSLDNNVIPRYTQLELAEEKHMSQQNIADLSKRTYQKIKTKYSYLEDYIR